MTTEPPPRRGAPARGAGADDRRQRLEQLRQRRSAPPVFGTRPGGEPAGRPKRSHAAAGGRIVAAGLSAGAALALVGAMARPTSPAPAAAPTDAPAPRTVIVVPRPTGGSLASSPSGRAPAVAPSAAPPVTTSQAS